MIYMIETKKEVFWANRKMDRDYRHATEFLYRDKARTKEMPEARFKKFRNNSPKTFHEIVD